jgi:hypothetical protein
MASGDGALPVLVIDGADFFDLDGFARELSKLLHHHIWRGNLDAFNDILRGGFGTPESGWVLGGSTPTCPEPLFDQIVEVIRQHGFGGDEPEDGIVLELR